MQLGSVQNDNLWSRAMENEMSEEFKKWSEEFDKKMAKLQARIERLENSMHEDPEKQLKLWNIWHNEKTDEN